MKPIAPVFDDQDNQTKTERKSNNRSHSSKKAEPKKNTPSLNERLVAPILLILTILISYVILIFS